MGEILLHEHLPFCVLCNTAQMGETGNDSTAVVILTKQEDHYIKSTQTGWQMFLLARKLRIGIQVNRTVYYLLHPQISLKEQAI